MPTIEHVSGDDELPTKPVLAIEEDDDEVRVLPFNLIVWESFWD